VGSRIAIALLLGFLLFITARRELGDYRKVIGL
jgi:hypothetical protein